MGKHAASSPIVWTFEVSIELPNLGVKEQNAFWNAFIAEAIEANDVLYGGLDHGFVEAESPESASTARSAVTLWLESRREPIGFLLGPVQPG